MQKTILIISFLYLSTKIIGQGCCSGGSGSPIAGGVSAGVLLDRQMEIATSYQYIRTHKFFSGDSDTSKLFDDFLSNYIYLKIAYGITKNLTMSVESGYYLSKTQYGLDKIDTIKSSGIGDLILFPRYDVYSRTTETKRTEITLGLGLKIPLGMYDDSTYTFTDFKGKRHFAISPPSVQPTTGSNDFIFYGFLFRSYPLKSFKIFPNSVFVRNGWNATGLRIFANGLYIRKGFNPLGEKFGDYASIGLFASTTLFKKVGVTIQVKGEWVNKMQAARNIDLLANYSVDAKSTGSKKILFVPQLSFTQNNFTIYALSEIPVYQYINKVQVGSQYQLSVGVSLKFFTVNAKNKIKKSGSALYQCEMKCKGGESEQPGKCKICGMDLIKQ